MAYRGADEASIEARIEAVLDPDGARGLSDAENVLLAYVDRITRQPATCAEEHVVGLRKVGWTDEQIHAAVQVAAYFNYINRVADALGVDLEPGMPAP